MITLHDMNQSWVAPNGFNFLRVDPKGAYLQVIYVRHYPGKMQMVTIYLESQGREVLRTTEEFLDPVAPPKMPELKPVAARFRFWNGFLIVLQGLREMLTCHRKS